MILDRIVFVMEGHQLYLNPTKMSEVLNHVNQGKFFNRISIN